MELARTHVLTRIILSQLIWFYFCAAQFSQPCPPSCICEFSPGASLEYKVACEDAGLTQIPADIPPETERLELQFNNITSVDKELQQLENLTVLELSFNLIKRIDDNAFANNSKLTVLYLDNNELTSLNHTYFANNPWLTSLYLEENKISILHEDFLQGATDLFQVDLSNNRLDGIRSDFLKHCRNVFFVNLRHNPIVSLQQTQFGFAPGLSVLELSNTEILYIHPEAFQGIGNLSILLTLGHNRLMNVPTQAFKNLPKLRSLTLSGTAITQIHGNAFNGLTGLETLRIEDSPNLRHIEAYAFQNLPNLRSLVLNNNKQLKYIHADAFKNSKCRSVRLTGNGLETLPSNVFPWSNMTTVTLDDNPWNCNCSLRFLRTTLQLPINWGGVQPECHTPLHLSGQPIRDLSENDFQCMTSSAPTPSTSRTTAHTWTKSTVWSTTPASTTPIIKYISEPPWKIPVSVCSGFVGGVLVVLLVVYIVYRRRLRYTSKDENANFHSKTGIANLSAAHLTQDTFPTSPSDVIKGGIPMESETPIYERGKRNSKTFFLEPIPSSPVTPTESENIPTFGKKPSFVLRQPKPKRKPVVIRSISALSNDEILGTSNMNSSTST